MASPWSWGPVGSPQHWGEVATRPSGHASPSRGEPRTSLGRERGRWGAPVRARESGWSSHGPHAGGCSRAGGRSDGGGGGGHASVWKEQCWDRHPSTWRLLGCPWSPACSSPPPLRPAGPFTRVALRRPEHWAFQGWRSSSGRKALLLAGGPRWGGGGEGGQTTKSPEKEKNYAWRREGDCVEPSWIGGDLQGADGKWDTGQGTDLSPAGCLGSLVFSGALSVPCPGWHATLSTRCPSAVSVACGSPSPAHGSEPPETVLHLLQSVSQTGGCRGTLIATPAGPSR